MTKEELAAEIAKSPQRTIGRALVALYRVNGNTINDASGFGAPDNRVGCIGARQWLSSAKLQDWIVEVWAKPDATGYPRLCKYIKQLNTLIYEKDKQVSKTRQENIQAQIANAAFTEQQIRKTFIEAGAVETTPGEFEFKGSIEDFKRAYDKATSHYHKA